MGFPFAWVCDLFEELEKVTSTPLLPNVLKKCRNDKTVQWLRNHCNKLNAHDTDADTVILTLKPETWANRDYGLDIRSLEQIIARALSLPKEHIKTLQLWRQQSPRGDLSLCVEKVLEDMNESKERVVPPYCVNQVTAENVNKTLLSTCSNNTYPSAAFKASTEFSTVRELCKLYQQLRYREAKWLTRLILGDLGSVKFPDELDCDPNQRSLPRCVLVKVKFQVSIPESERRDGPGLMRLRAARKAYEDLSPTPSTTAPESASSAAIVATLPHPQVLVDNTPTRVPQFEQILTPPAIVPASYGARVSNSHQPRVVTKPLGRIRPLQEFPTTPTTAPELPSPDVTSTTLSLRYIMNNDRPIRMTPLGERRDIVNHQIPRLRRTPRHKSHVHGKLMSPPIHNSPRTENHTPSKQQSSCMVNDDRETPREGRVHSPSASLFSICGSGKCQLTKTTCPLANCIFLLAPCIAKVPWIIDNLLTWHGSRYVSSAKTFSNLDFPRGCSQTRMLYRKVVLVEPRNMELTVEFLRKVERLVRRRTRGTKQTVEVYDWRILESLAKVDRGKGLGEKSWTRYRIYEV